MLIIHKKYICIYTTKDKWHKTSKPILRLQNWNKSKKSIIVLVLRLLEAATCSYPTSSGTGLRVAHCHAQALPLRPLSWQHNLLPQGTETRNTAADLHFSQYRCNYTYPIYIHRYAIGCHFPLFFTHINFSLQM